MRTRFLLSSALVVLALGLTGGRLSAQGATSVCKDGTTSAASGKGACSGHGGVDAKATAAAKKAAKSTATKTATAPATTPPTTTPPATAASKSAATKTVPATSKSAATKTVPAAKTATASEKDSVGAVAACKDGTYSHASSHKGACSRHGGVAKFLKP